MTISPPSTSTPSASPTPPSTPAPPSAPSRKRSEWGEDRARPELRADTLRRVERAAKHKRETDTAYDTAIDRAARLGLSHRDIAAAAVSHGTVRAVLARTRTTTALAEPVSNAHGHREVNEEHVSDALAASTELR